MAETAWPFWILMVPTQPAHACCFPTTVAPGDPLLAGPRSRTVQTRVVVQPPHLPDEWDSIFTSWVLSAGFATARFQNCGPGPASAAAVKRPLASKATKLLRRFRVFIGVSVRRLFCSSALHLGAIGPSTNSAHSLARLPRLLARSSNRARASLSVLSG
jgi:hypothetical protein